MYDIEVDKGYKFIKQTYYGDIHSNEIGTAWKEILKIPEFSNGDYNLFSDYRKSTYLFDLDDLDVIWKFFYSIKDIVKGKKEAVLNIIPQNVAISMIFEYQIYQEIGFNVKVFSTEEAALRWISY